MRRTVWLLSSVALLPMLANAAGGGWGAGGGSVSDNAAARAAAALVRSSTQQTKNHSDLANANVALGKLDGIPVSMIGAPSGVVGLDAKRLAPAAQIRFGSVAKTGADGRKLAATALTAAAAGGGWGAGGGLVAVDAAARVAAAAALALAQSSTQQTKNLSDLANAGVALGNLGGIPLSMIGAPSGVAGLDANRLVPAAQIPFGLVAKTVADGGILAATALTANAAVPTSMIGVASGVASLNGSKLLSTSQIPFGTAAGTVADGGALAATSAMANAAIPGSLIGAASGVAALGATKLLTAAEIPFGIAAGTVADGEALAATSAMANAAIPSSLIGAASGVAALGANKLLTASEIPFGTAAGTVADGGALASTSAVANAAIPSSLIGAASGIAALGSNKLLTASEIPFGNAAGTVADGGALASTSATANAAIPSSLIGAASGLAALGSNKLLTASEIPFGIAAGTVADGGALAATAAMANAAIPSSLIGAASGLAALGSNKLLTTSEIPFGTAAGTVADGGVLAAALATANAAIPSSLIGAASGLAALGSNKLLTTSEIPFGTATGTVADGGALAATLAMANAAIPSSLIGAASGLAALGSNKLLTASEIPFGTVTGTVADGGALAVTTVVANAAIPSSLIGAASGVAGLNASKVMPAAQIPFGTTSGTVADGGSLATTTATANAAVPSTRLGAASGVATLDGNKLLPTAQVPFGTVAGTVADGGALATASAKAVSALQPANIGSTGTSGVAAYNDPRIVGAAPLASPIFTGTPQLTTDPATGDTSKDIVSAGWVSRLVSSAGSTATSVGSGTDLSQGKITPTGASSAQSAAAIAALATGAVPSSQLGIASGVAQLDSNKHVVSAQIPFGTTAGTVTDGGVFTTAMQNVAVTFLTIAKADGGIVHVLGLNGVAETVGRTIAARAGDVWNIADHGADHTVAGDDAAMVEALAYAKAVPGTHIYFPTGTWPMAASSQFTYLVPSETLIEGADEYATDILFTNDTNTGAIPSGQTCQQNPSLTCQYYLFAADQSNGRPHDIGVRHIRFTGTWGGAGSPASAFASVGNGPNMFLFDHVDNVDIEDTIWEQERAFGIFVSGSTDVKVHNNVVRYVQADAIAVWQSSNISILGNFVEHGNDDCISFHNADSGDPWIQRRAIDIEGNTCFDSTAISGQSAKYTVIMGNRMVSSRGDAIAISTVTGGTSSTAGTSGYNGSQQGNSSSDNVIIADNVMTDLLARGQVDNYDGANSYIYINGLSARPGQYGAIPGEAGFPGSGTSGQTGYKAPTITAQDPAPEFFADAQLATTAVGESHSIIIAGNTMESDMPSFNSTDSRFNSYTDLGQGPLVSLNGLLNPTNTAALMYGQAIGINVNGGAMRDVSIHDNAFEGFTQGIYFGPGLSYTDFDIYHNDFFNLSGAGVELNSTGINDITVADNLFDMDPYLHEGYRSNTSNGYPGGWQYDAVDCAVRVDQGSGLTILRNRIKNASDDICGADPVKPTGGIYAADNLDYADLQAYPSNSTLNSFSKLNLGIGYIHTSGFRVVGMYGDPTKTTFGTLFSVPVQAAPAVPSAGFWYPGDYVRDTTPTASAPTEGWLRVTMGSGNVLGTDWIAK